MWHGVDNFEATIEVAKSPGHHSSILKCTIASLKRLGNHMQGARQWAWKGRCVERQQLPIECMYEPNLPRGALASATLHLRNYRARTIPYEEGVVSLAAMVPRLTGLKVIKKTLVQFQFAWAVILALLPSAVTLIRRHHN